MEQRTSRLALARDYFLDSVDAIPLDGWKRATLCEGWTPVHIVAHVATGDQLTRGIVFDGIGRSRAGQDLPADFADRKRRFEQSLSLEPEKLKEMARTESEQTVAAITDAVEKAPTTVVTMPYGPVPLTGVRALRVNEYIIHGHDLTPAIGRSIPTPDWFIDRALGDAVGLMTRLHLRSPHKGRPRASTSIAPMATANGRFVPRVGRRLSSRSTARPTSPFVARARGSTGC